MKLFRKKVKRQQRPDALTRTAALNAVPRRAPTVRWESLDSGEIIIEYPLNLRPFFVQLANRFSRRPAIRPTRKLQLDETGSRAWQMFDGKTAVKKIISEVARESGLSLQEAEISVTSFLRQLGRRGLILLD